MTTHLFFSSSIPLYYWTRNLSLLLLLLSSGFSLCSPIWGIKCLEARESLVWDYKYNQNVIWNIFNPFSCLIFVSYIILISYTLEIGNRSCGGPPPGVDGHHPHAEWGFRKKGPGKKKFQRYNDLFFHQPAEWPQAHSLNILQTPQAHGLHSLHRLHIIPSSTVSIGSTLSPAPQSQQAPYYPQLHSLNRLHIIPSSTFSIVSTGSTV